MLFTKDTNITDTRYLLKIATTHESIAYYAMYISIGCSLVVCALYNLFKGTAYGYRALYNRPMSAP